MELKLGKKEREDFLAALEHAKIDDPKGFMKDFIRAFESVKDALQRGHSILIPERER